MSATRRIRTAAAGAAGAVAGVAVALLAGSPARGVAVDVAFGLGAALGGALGWHRPTIAPSWLAALAAALLAAPLATTGARGVGAFVGLLGVMGVALWWASRQRDDARPPEEARRFVIPALCLSGVAFVVYTVFAVERHRRFGSGSWDYACYVHNAWLFAAGDAFSLSARSSVLGDVAFWGGTNHFMPSLVLTAPLAWLMEATGDTSWLAIAQNAVVVATAVPLALLARRRGLDPLTSAAVIAAFLAHVGTQAALLFDVHEIAPVPLLLVTAAVVVADPPTPRRATALGTILLLCAGTKESSWLYVAGFGAFMLASAPAWRRHALVVVAVGAVGFVVVVGAVQPGLLEPGAAMIHAARFRGVGDAPADGLLQAALSMAVHPGRAMAALVTPTEKLATLLTSTGGFGHAPLLSPSGLLLGAPNLVERFLSDKREMWGLAFHYGLVTAGWLAIAAVDTLGRWRGRLPPPALALLVMGGAAVSLGTSPRTPDLASLEKPYFASVDDVSRFERALAVIQKDDAVVAQNHFLPHLALRRHIWLPEARFVERADVVILDARASPWPHDRRHVQRLVSALDADDRFEVAFREGTTVVFRRRSPTSGAPLDGAPQ